MHEGQNKSISPLYVEITPCNKTARPVNKTRKEIGTDITRINNNNAVLGLTN